MKKLALCKNVSTLKYLIIKCLRFRLCHSVLIFISSGIKFKWKIFEIMSIFLCVRVHLSNRHDIDHFWTKCAHIFMRMCNGSWTTDQKNAPILQTGARKVSGKRINFMKKYINSCVQMRQTYHLHWWSHAKYSALIFILFLIVERGGRCVRPHFALLDC